MSGDTHSHRWHFIEGLFHAACALPPQERADFLDRACGDDDDLRRGRPTVHREFDEATAILAGDALLPLAFGVIADSPALGDRHKAALSGLIASASGSLGMTGGQAIDLASEGKRLTVDELKLMHDLKTGALIHASVMMAAASATALPEETQGALDRYGRALGLAFQVQDDILDVEGDTEVLGKRVQADAARRADQVVVESAAETLIRCEDQQQVNGEIGLRIARDDVGRELDVHVALETPRQRL